MIAVKLTCDHEGCGRTETRTWPDDEHAGTWQDQGFPPEEPATSVVTLDGGVRFPPGWTDEFCPEHQP